MTSGALHLPTLIPHIEVVTAEANAPTNGAYVWLSDGSNTNRAIWGDPGAGGGTGGTTEGTILYCELKRVGSIVTLNIWTNASRSGTPDWTGSITSSAAFTYLEAMISENKVGGTSVMTASGYIENLDTGASGGTTFQITASAGPNGSISPSGAVQVQQGYSQAFTITPATNYSVQSVLVDGVSVGALTYYNFSNVQANHTISVSFVYSGGGTTFTITASAGANGTINPTGQVSVAQGGNQAFTITPSAGYNVQSVLVDGVSAGAITYYNFQNVQANHSISATFVYGGGGTTFTITASAGAGGAISPTGSVIVTQGGQQAFSITANSGYNITAVYVDGVNQGALTYYNFTNVQANHSISATFQQGGGPFDWTWVLVGVGVAGTATAIGVTVFALRRRKKKRR